MTSGIPNNVNPKLRLQAAEESVILLSIYPKWAQNVCTYCLHPCKYMCGSYHQRVIPVSPPDILWRFFSPSSIHRHPLALPRFITPRCLLGYGHSVEIYFCGRCKSRPHYHVLVSHTPAMLIISFRNRTRCMGCWGISIGFLKSDGWNSYSWTHPLVAKFCVAKYPASHDVH